MARVLIVEDQKKLLQSLRRGLEEEGYDVITAATGEEGYYLATTGSPDAIVLDLMLPGRDGLKVLRDLRSQGYAKPVLILTARDAVEDRVAGLDGGADDYLVKPFAFAELLARLRALLRRDVSGRELTLRADDLEIDLLSRRVIRGGVELDLTRREYELLEFLLRHKNETVTRDMIGREVWKETSGSLTNTIDVYINALRQEGRAAGATTAHPHRPRCRLRGEGWYMKGTEHPLAADALVRAGARHRARHLRRSGLRRDAPRAPGPDRRGARRGTRRDLRGYPGRQGLDEALGAIAAALRPTRGVRVSGQPRER